MGFIAILYQEWHHDKRWIKATQHGAIRSKVTEDGFAYRVNPISALSMIEIAREGDRPLPITLCHYPLHEWDRGHYGALMFHGHSHGNLPDDCLGDDKKFLDIGVDTAYKELGQFRPFSIREAIELCG